MKRETGRDTMPGMKDVFRSVQLCSYSLCFKRPVGFVSSSSFGATAFRGPWPPRSRGF